MPSKKPVAKKATKKPAAKPAIKKQVKKTAAKKTAAKTPAKKTAAKKPVAKKSASKKPTAKKSSVKKPSSASRSSAAVKPLTPAARERLRLAAAAQKKREAQARAKEKARQAAAVAGYLASRGVNAVAPAQAPATQPSKTTIVVYNGAASRAPETIALLQAVFGVKVTLAADPAARADIVITTSQRTPDLTPPPGP